MPYDEPNPDWFDMDKKDDESHEDWKKRVTLDGWNDAGIGADDAETLLNTVYQALPWGLKVQFASGDDGIKRMRGGGVLMFRIVPENTPGSFIPEPAEPKKAKVKVKNYGVAIRGTCRVSGVIEVQATSDEEAVELAREDE